MFRHNNYCGFVTTNTAVKVLTSRLKRLPLWARTRLKKTDNSGNLFNEMNLSKLLFSDSPLAWKTFIGYKTKWLTSKGSSYSVWYQIVHTEGKWLRGKCCEDGFFCFLCHVFILLKHLLRPTFAVTHCSSMARNDFLRVLWWSCSWSFNIVVISQGCTEHIEAVIAQLGLQLPDCWCTRSNPVFWTSSQTSLSVLLGGERKTLRVAFGDPFQKNYMIKKLLDWAQMNSETHTS